MLTGDGSLREILAKSPTNTRQASPATGALEIGTVSVTVG
jgi:hypothetical protein